MTNVSPSPCSSSIHPRKPLPTTTVLSLTDGSLFRDVDDDVVEEVEACCEVLLLFLRIDALCVSSGSTTYRM